MAAASQDAEPYQQALGEVFERFGVDPRTGLTTEAARTRLQNYGPNAIVGRTPDPAWKKFLAQFGNVLVLLLIAAGLISLGLWFWERESEAPFEAIAIFGIVLLNAVLGYVQEARAEQALAALSRMSAAQAKVLRDGVQQSLPAAEVVPGDIIVVEEGDTAPADARLLRATALQVSEAALTGESLPVSKDIAAISGEVPLGDRHNMIFSGTSVAYGHGLAVVTATGMQTEIGRIAGLLEAAPAEITPLQKALDRLGGRLAVIVVAIAAVMVAAILVTGGARGPSAVFDAFILGVALAVAAVPEGLPAVVTTVLSLGVQRMVRRNAVVRRLSSVETLGSADVIASDKTGTLTRNEMTVRRIITASGAASFTGSGYSAEGEVRAVDGAPIEGIQRIELLRTLAAVSRANNATIQESEGGWTVRGDPTEGALLVAGRKMGADLESRLVQFTRVAEVPFSSERKLMSTVEADAAHDTRLVAVTKGAPDVLLSRCAAELVGDEVRQLTDGRRAEILAANDALADQALRTLAVAVRFLSKADFGDNLVGEDLERDLVLLGLIGMIDPPREEAKAAVARARGAGVRLIMITGDHPRTARVIAQELGLVDDDLSVTGVEIAAMSTPELDRTVAGVSVYARVNPEHKLRIVEALQRQGRIVAMTGDGVNDAPALKTADIGVAMGIAGTDVSKQAADMVLADDNFATIVAAVEEGRGIFANIRKFLRFLLSSNIGEVMTMFGGVLLAGVIGLRGNGDTFVLPLLATQILWINLVTDGAPALALGVDPVDPDVMNRPPRPRAEGVITGRMWRGIFVVGATMAVGTLAVLDASLPGGLIAGSGTLAHAQTMAFTTLMLFQVVNTLNARSDEVSAFRGLFRNRWLWLSLGLSLGLQFAVVNLPLLQAAFSTVALSAQDWLTCALVASSVLWVRELMKLLGRLKPDGRLPPEASSLMNPGASPSRQFRRFSEGDRAAGHSGRSRRL
jgi:Ca2+-transporting ATPase